MFTPWFKTFIATVVVTALLLYYVDSAQGQSLYLCMSEKDKKGNPACWTGEEPISPFKWLKGIAPFCDLKEVKYIRGADKEVSIIKLVCVEKKGEKNVDLVL